MKILSGQVVRDLRRQRGMSGRHLSKLIHVTPGYLSMMEVRDRQPSLEIVERIAGVFGVRRSDLSSDHVEPNMLRVRISELLDTPMTEADLTAILAAIIRILDSRPPPTAKPKGHAGASPTRKTAGRSKRRR